MSSPPRSLLLGYSPEWEKIRQKEKAGLKPEKRELMTCQGTWGLVSFLPLTSCVT